MIARKSSAGFTLMELLIVVVIVGILAALAYPSYTRWVVRTKRAAAATCLTEAAQFMERYYTTNLRYDQNLAGTAVAFPTLGCANDLSNEYMFGFNGAPARTTYMVQAVPNAAVQNDPLCGTLTYNQAGVKGESGTAASAEECFR